MPDTIIVTQTDTGIEAMEDADYMYEENNDGDEPNDWQISETLKNPSNAPIFANSTISMEAYAVKMNALRLKHRLPDRATNELLKTFAEMAGNTKMPRTVNKLNKLSTKSKNHEDCMAFRSISINADCSVFTLENQLVNVVKRK